MTQKVEWTTTALDVAPEKTVAERLKFKLEFMVMMIQAGREEHAMDAYVALVEEIDALDC